VIGWPWNTTVLNVFEDSVVPAAGEPCVNRGVQVIRLRWGKAVIIHTYVDTAKSAAALDFMAASGLEEAEAPQICE
jgi:hypothetical protein